MKKVLIKQIDNEKAYNLLGSSVFTSIYFSKTEEDSINIYNQLKNVGYDVVAECCSNLSISETLNECFKYFNIQHDDTKLSNIEYKCKIADGSYNMHSMSVCDVVKIENSSYLCTPNGWTLIKD